MKLQEMMTKTQAQKIAKDGEQISFMLDTDHELRRLRD